jgi:HSP20 family protein
LCSNLDSSSISFVDWNYDESGASKAPNAEYPKPLKGGATMANVTRWDPFSEFTPLRQMMDRLLEDAWVRPPNTWTQMSQSGFGSFASDLYETEDEYVVTATLPGLKPEDLEINVQGNVVTISGELKSDEREGEQRNYHTRERRYGRFSRQVSLPAGIQGDRIQATLEHGILTLHVPKAEEMKPRRIQIGTGSGTGTAEPRMIEGQHKVA